MQEKLGFRQETRALNVDYDDLDKGPLYLEYQRLDVRGDKLEAIKNLSEEVQTLLETIGERQTAILNQILIN